MRPDVVFRRLVLPVPPTVEQIERLLRRLGQGDAPRPLVFETRAAASRLEHLVGTSPELLASASRVLVHFLPSARLIPAHAKERMASDRTGVVRFVSRGLGLDQQQVEAAVHAVHAAFAAVRADERAVLQLVFGSGHRPVPTPAAVPDPVQSTLSVALDGVREARGRVRRDLEQRRALVRLTVTIRIGVSAGDSARRRVLASSLLGALRVLEAPGARLELAPDTPERLALGLPARVRRAQLSTPEVVALLAWPLDGLELPAQPAHPRRLPPPSGLPKGTGHVIGISSALGVETPIALSAEARLHHLAIAGPTGSGKSTVLGRLAIDSAAAHEPLALIDPKRQLVDAILDALPASAAGRVVVLDPADAQPVGFNPLDTSGRNAEVVVDGILSALKAIFEEGWGPRTEDLLFAGLRSLAAAGERRSEPFTLIDLPRLFTNAALRRQVAGLVADDALLAAYWAAFDGQSPQAQAQVVAAPLNKLRRFLLRSNLVRVLGQSRPAFRVRDLFRTDKVLLVPLNDALIGPGSAQLLGSLLVSELWQAVQERAGEKEPRKRPGTVIVDEVQRFLHLPTSLDDATATSRGYGVSWVFAHQFRDQLPHRLNAALDANARTRMVFNTTIDDARDFAKTSPLLAPEDFTTLDQYEAQLSVYQSGRSSEWFSVRTLPLPHEGNGNLLREASDGTYGASVPPDLPSPGADDMSPTSSGYRKRRAT